MSLSICPARSNNVTFQKRIPFEQLQKGDIVLAIKNEGIVNTSLPDLFLAKVGGIGKQAMQLNLLNQFSCVRKTLGEWKRCFTFDKPNLPEHTIKNYELSISERLGRKLETLG
jgi:hypothetical protein